MQAGAFRIIRVLKTPSCFNVENVECRNVEKTMLKCGGKGDLWVMPIEYGSCMIQRKAVILGGHPMNLMRRNFKIGHN